MSLTKSFFRGVSFALGFLIMLSIGLIGVASAANGGIFGEILNKILASGSYENPGDGIVKNAQQLGWVDANKYQKATAWQTCGGTQCIAGIDANGKILCH